MPHLNWKKLLIAAVAVAVIIRFADPIRNALAKVPGLRQIAAA